MITLVAMFFDSPVWFHNKLTQYFARFPETAATNQSTKIINSLQQSLNALSELTSGLPALYDIRVLYG